MIRPVAYAVAFGAGVTSFVAPCVVPLMPAYVAALLGAPSAGEPDPVLRRRVIGASALFVAGLACVFVPLGLAATTIGRLLRTHQSGVTVAAGFIVVVLGLAQLGLIRRLPIGAAPTRLAARLAHPGGSTAGHLRPFLLGMALGTVWTPCVGPILGAVLVLAASAGNAAAGGSLLLAYTAGVGAPFLILALLLTGWPRVLRVIGRKAAVLARAAGIAMVALGMLLATGAYTSLSGFLARFAVRV